MVQLKAKDFSANGTFGKLLGDMGAYLQREVKMTTYLGVAFVGSIFPN